MVLIRSVQVAIVKALREPPFFTDRHSCFWEISAEAPGSPQPLRSTFRDVEIQSNSLAVNQYQPGIDQILAGAIVTCEALHSFE
jgi:hypothetical protein